MRKLIKILCLILSIILLLSATACGDSEDEISHSDGPDSVNDFDSEVSDAGFKDGYSSCHYVEEEISISDLVDNKGASFSLVAEKEGDEDIDLSSEDYWVPNKIGKYTLKLSINGGDNEGDYEIEMTIKAPPITLEFASNRVTFNSGELISFETMVKKLKIKSNFEEYGTVTKRIYSVIFNDAADSELIKFTAEDTGYTFPEAGSYNIVFGVEAEDGQFYKMVKTVVVY